MRISVSSMIVALKEHTEWRIVCYEKCGDKAYVMVDVVGYSLIVWIFTRRSYQNKSIWMMLGVWKVSIYRIWKLCKIFVSDIQ